MRRTRVRDAHRAAVTLLLSGLMVAIGLFVATPASACSCVGGTTQEFLDRADAVFTGRVISREEPTGPIMSSGDPALHVFSVETVYTGTAHEQQGVLWPSAAGSPRSSRCCTPSGARPSRESWC